MPIDRLDRIRIRYRDMVGLYSHQRAILAMGIMHRLVPTPTAALEEKPEV